MLQGRGFVSFPNELVNDIKATRTPGGVPRRRRQGGGGAAGLATPQNAAERRSELGDSRCRRKSGPLVLC